MILQSKIIAMYSSLAQTGQTTNATMLGLALAKKNKYVLIIEFTDNTGMSTFLNKGFGEFKRNLANCVKAPDRTKKNIIKSGHSKNLFYIAQNRYNTIEEMHSYPPENIDKMVSEVTGLFDYIILDLPSNPKNKATLRVLGGNFNHKIHHRIYGINESALSVKLLNDIDAVLAKSNGTKADGRFKTTLVVSKSRSRYSSFLEPYLQTMENSDIVNIVNVLEVPEMVYLSNEGNIFDIGKTRESKEYLTDIERLADIIEHDKMGVGMVQVKATKTELKRKGARLGDEAVQGEVKQKKKGLFNFGGKPKQPKQEKKQSPPKGKGGKQNRQPDRKRPPKSKRKGDE